MRRKPGSVARAGRWGGGDLDQEETCEQEWVWARSEPGLAEPGHRRAPVEVQPAEAGLWVTRGMRPPICRERQCLGG